MGFVSLLIIYIVSKGYDRHRVQTLKKPIQTYITGFTFTLVNMTVFGIYEVVSQEQATFSEAALEGTSGIGHIILGVGLVWTMVRLFKNEEMISLIKQKAKG